MNDTKQQASIIKRLQNFFEREQDVGLVILFGSMATGKYSENSDVDLAIRMAKPLTALQKKHLIEHVADITGRAVDIIDLSTVGEPLLGQIIKYGKRLMGSNADYAELALQHVYAQADFVPYIERMLKERRQQWINS